MAKKGQKFNKVNIEIKLEICRRHFEGTSTRRDNF